MSIPDRPAPKGQAEPLLLVLDTNVCLDLFVFAEPACCALLDALVTGRVRAVTRDDCRNEWLRVLRYPKLGLDEERILAAQSRFDALVALVPTLEHSCNGSALPRCTDPDDQKFLELARDQQAFALLTRDLMLLQLSASLLRRNLFDVLQPELLIRQLNLH